MKHDPNLFEAFKDVSEKAAEQPKASKASSPSPSPSAGSPLAGSGLEPRLLVVGLLLVVASFAAGWFLRGPGGGPVLAKGPDETPAGVQPGPGDPGAGGGSWLDDGGAEEWAPAEPPVASNSGSGEVSAASGLYNRANEHTVLAITYANLPSLEVRARSTAQYLRDQGLPAYDPIRNGDNIEILVGAAPTKSELQGILTKLQRTRGPSGTSFDFQSALPVRIDSRVDRD